jgi:hypothetical protein
METEQKTDTLYKVRSYSNCLQKGFELYTNNFKLIFKQLWMPASIYALTSLVVILFLPTLQSSAIQTGSKTLSAAYCMTLAGIIVVITLAQCLVIGHLFALLNKYRELGYLPATTPKAILKDIRHYWWRAIKNSLWTALVIFMVSFISALAIVLIVSLAHKPGMIATILLVLLVILVIVFFLIPVLYIYIKYLMEPGHYFTIFKKTFGKGVRHWGKIFILALITSIIVLIAEVIVCSPLIIVTIATNLSNAALADGDPTGLPAYFTVLTSVISVICSFLQIFASIFFYFPMLFIYGSIEQEDKEEKELKTQTAKNFNNDEEDFIH